MAKNQGTPIEEPVTPVEEQIKPVEEQKALLTIDDYAKAKKPNKGLIASLKVELAKVSKGLDPKSEEEWDEAFKNQSKKVYK